MHSLPAIDGAAPPRLLRAVGLQLLALAGAGLVSALPWPRRQPAPVPMPEPKKQEKRIRIVQLPRPPPVARPDPAPPSPVKPAAPARPAPPESAPQPAPAPAPPLARIAADSTAMHGVRMRVLVPRSPDELAAHLRNSGACLVISRLSGGSAEVLSVLSLDAVRGGAAAGARSRAERGAGRSPRARSRAGAGGRSRLPDHPQSPLAGYRA